MTERTSSALLHTILGITVAGVIAWFVAGSWERLGQVEWTGHPAWIATHFALLVACLGCLALGWWVLLRGVGHPMRITVATYTWLVPNLGKYVPGKVLMLAGRIELCRRQGMPRASCMGALILENVIIVLAATPFLIAAVLLNLGGPETGVSRSGLVGTGAVVGVIVVAILGLVVVANPRLLSQMVKGVAKVFRRGDVGFHHDRATALRLLILYFIAWSAYGASGVALMHAMSIGENVPLTVQYCSFVGAWLLGFVSVFTPGGLAVREAAQVGLLSPFLPSEDAMAVAVVARLTWSAVEMLGVGLGILLRRLG